jgi:hypothetical protein
MTMILKFLTPICAESAEMNSGTFSASLRIGAKIVTAFFTSSSRFGIRIVKKLMSEIAKMRIEKDKRS